MFSAIPRLWSRGSSGAMLAKEALLGAQTAGVPIYREALGALSLELRRARRYERPLAVVVLGPDSPRAMIGRPNNRNADLQVPPSAHLIFFLLGAFLRDSMRETDIVTYAAEHHLYVAVLPETTKQQVSRAICRLGQVFYDRTSMLLQVGVADFPKDGLTIEDLLSSAHQSLHSEPLPGHYAPELREARNA